MTLPDDKWPMVVKQEGSWLGYCEVHQGWIDLGPLDIPFSNPRIDLSDHMDSCHSLHADKEGQ